MRPADTIVAPATPPAPAARAIVRVSGDRAFEFVDAIAATPSEMPHAAALERPLHLADGIDVPTTVYAFRGPRSSTGEDVCELHLPGSPLFVRLAVGRLLALGARMAEPGEFTARAFFHGKLDLARAEGVAATIAAANRRELDAARQLLAGELARRVLPISEAIASLLALVEAGIDFADEAVDFLPDAMLRSRIAELDATLAALAGETARIERLSHEPRIVLTGRPNAGKSTLLNVLAGTARAVISDVAGTTRDALSARVPLRRGTVTLVDTAGLDEQPAGFDEQPAGFDEQPSIAVRSNAGEQLIEAQMRATALGEIERADAIVRVIASDGVEDERAFAGGATAAADERDGGGRRADLIVYTKRDLAPSPDDGRLRVSAATGENLAALHDALDAIAFGVADAGEGGRTLALNARHVAAIAAARRALGEAAAAIEAGHEFVAAGLRVALDDVGGITGSISADDVLGRIFGSFCIGK